MLIHFISTVHSSSLLLVPTYRTYGGMRVLCAQRWMKTENYPLRNIQLIFEGHFFTPRFLKTAGRLES
jgi:hypothetical protein